MAKSKRISLATYKAIEEHLLICTGHADNAIARLKRIDSSGDDGWVDSMILYWKNCRQGFAYAIEQARSRVKKEQSQCPDNS